MIFDLLTFAQDWLADNHVNVNRTMNEEQSDPILESSQSPAPKVAANIYCDNILIALEQPVDEQPVPLAFCNFSGNELIESSEKPLLASREIPDRPQIDSVSYSPEELVQIQQEDVLKVSLTLTHSYCHG